MKTFVKICGVREKDMALFIEEKGADFLGLNFVLSSKRYLTPSAALHIRKALGSEVKIVGVFKDDTIEFVNEIAEEVGLDLIQLHGSEDPAYCAQIARPIIKAFQLPNVYDPKVLSDSINTYNVDYYLLDREKQGEGATLDLTLIDKLTLRSPFFLAGGLTIEKVSEMIASVHPFAVDVASGIEENGAQSREKIAQFIQEAKQ